MCLVNNLPFFFTTRQVLLSVVRLLTVHQAAHTPTHTPLLLPPQAQACVVLRSISSSYACTCIFTYVHPNPPPVPPPPPLAFRPQTTPPHPSSTYIHITYPRTRNPAQPISAGLASPRLVHHFLIATLRCSTLTLTLMYTTLHCRGGERG